MGFVSLLLLGAIAACAPSVDPDPGPDPGPGPEPEPERGQTPIYYRDPVFADGQYVKVGARGYTIGDTLDTRKAWDGIIAVSTDSTNWQITEFVESGALWDVAYGDGRWLAVGSDFVYTDVDQSVEITAAFTAPTGGEWEPAADPPEDVYGIAYGAGRWVVSGNFGLAQAVDGENWEPIAETETLWWFPGVDFLAGVFVAYGEGPGLLDSADGVTWNFFDTHLTAITDVSEKDGQITAHGYYDCCYGEIPEAVEHYTLTRTADGNWTIVED